MLLNLSQLHEGSDNTSRIYMGEGVFILSIIS
jgi:hypothetical protein